MNSSRRRILAGTLALGCGAWAKGGCAQDAWPSKPIRFISAGAPGGGSDIFVRVLETRLKDRLGQNLFIENHPGAGGMTAARVFELVRRIREKSQVPIVFYTYYNLVFSNGVENYVRAAKEAGVDGMLTLDLPPEEADELLAACAQHGLKTIFIVAPTTPASRLPRIGAAATGFIYYVSREGVTGVRDQVAANIPEAVARIRQHTTLPVAVGFGLSTPEQVKQVARVADGVVVGSALVNVIKDNLDNRAGLPARLRIAAAELVAGAA